MIEVATLLLVVGLSILITRIATVALTLTGLSKESSKFQARSAFTGVGFTTSESEKVVNHPVRRRIVLMLMFMGNAGVISAVSLMIVTVVRSTSTVDIGLRILLLAAGLISFWILSNSKLIDRWLTETINWALRRWTTLHVRDYARLLGIQGGFEVTEIAVSEDTWLANKRLDQLDLSHEGVLVLGIIQGDGTYLGAPPHQTIINAGCKIIIYGPEDRLVELAQRKAGFIGDETHKQAVDEKNI